METAKKILLIDDDEDDRWLFSEALARTAPAVECITAPGAEAALKLLNQVDTLPDLIFLDLNMPGMDGKMCLSIIKRTERLKNIPVFVYSTSNYQGDVNEAMIMGASRFVIKPSGYTQLCEMFKEMFVDQKMS